MVNDVLGDLADTFLRADDRLKLCPLRLELLRTFDLLAFGGLLEVGIDHWLLALVEGQLGKAAFVVNGDSRPVLHGAADVVNADIVAEDGPRVGVL